LRRPSYKKTPNIDDCDDVYQDTGLVNGARDANTEVIRPLFRRAQLYDQDIPAVKIDFGETGDVYQIDVMTIRFPANFSCGTTERRNSRYFITYERL
jgi:hypothetical protein